MPVGAQQKDYYAALGVDRKAKAEEIRKAYRRLARKHHPDVNPGNKQAEEKFKNIQEAYDVLGDEKKRKIYDKFGFYSDNIPPGGYEAYSQAPAGGGGPSVDFSGFDFSDYIPREERGGGGPSFRDLFSQIFSRGGARDNCCDLRGHRGRGTGELPRSPPARVLRPGRPPDRVERPFAVLRPHGPVSRTLLRPRPRLATHLARGGGR